MVDHIEPQFQQKAVKQIYRDMSARSIPGVFSYIAVWLLLAVPAIKYFELEDQLNELIVISGLIIFSSLFRGAMVIYHAYLDKKRTDAVKLPLFAGVFVSSLTWGLCSAYLVTHNQFQEVIYALLTCTAGIAAGGVAVLSASTLLSMSLMNMLLLPISVALLMVDITFAKPMAVISLFYMFCLFIIGRTLKAQYLSGLNNQYKLEEQTEKLAELNTQDPLTQLKNKRYFNDKLTEEFHRATRDKNQISLILIDIDHFKLVNDSYGHLIGDECLKEVSRIIKSQFNRASDIVARIGGEEFAVLLPGMPHENALMLADNIRRTIGRASILFKDREVSITVSSGIATMHPTEDSSPHELFSRADAALYSAKDRGRNRVACSPIVDLFPKPNSKNNQ